MGQGNNSKIKKKTCPMQNVMGQGSNGGGWSSVGEWCWGGQMWVTVMMMVVVGVSR